MWDMRNVRNGKIGAQRKWEMSNMRNGKCEKRHMWESGNMGNKTYETRDEMGKMRNAKWGIRCVKWEMRNDCEIRN